MLPDTELVVGGRTVSIPLRLYLIGSGTTSHSGASSECAHAAAACPGSGQGNKWIAESSDRDSSREGNLN